MNAPPPAVVAAFCSDDAAGRAESLPGGQGTAWRVGNVVLKPVVALVEAEYVAALHARLSARRDASFRVPRPVAAGGAGGAGGRYVVDGWQAWEWLPGRQPTASAADWAEVVLASRSFHRALRDEPRPAFIDERDDPWSVGDRAAWDDAFAFDSGPVLAPLVERLLARRRPVSLPDQLVHGDIWGNVLLAPGSPPAVIDLSPYWHAAAWALAVAAVDALAWSDASPSILDTIDDEPEIDQLLLRALVYRLATDAVARRGEAATLAASRRAHEPVADLILARLARSAA